MRVYIYIFMQRISVIFDTLTDICKLICQMAPPAVGFESKLELFWLVILLPWPLTFRPLNEVMIIITWYDTEQPNFARWPHALDEGYLLNGLPSSRNLETGYQWTRFLWLHYVWWYRVTDISLMLTRDLFAVAINPLIIMSRVDDVAMSRYIDGSLS